MLLKLLFTFAAKNTKVVLKDAADHQILFSGKFEDFPYQYANYCIDEFAVIGNGLVIFIYN